MAVEIKSSITRKIELGTDFDTVFGLLEDPPATARYFPKLENMEKLGDNSWRWDMERIGLGSVTFLKLSFNCRYRIERNKGVISWEPLDRDDRATIEGRLTVTTTDNGCRLDIESSGTGRLKLPTELEPILTSLATMVAEHLVDRFLHNIRDALNE